MMITTQNAGAFVLILALTAMGTQAASRAPFPAAIAQPAIPPGEGLTAAELEELLGPIALYPDNLLANVLAAAVYPDEVAGIARAVAAGATPEQLAERAWEEPVKAVAKVPDALKMMADYPEWTVALGQAYLNQPKDVMAAVQSLRKQAQQNGALQTSAEQEVVVREETIVIESSDPEYVYVPWYDPGVVYVDDPGDELLAGAIGFGAGILVGAALDDLDCDWHGGCVGWGWHGGDVDIDINGDVNIGNEINRGNRVGNEGNAWQPDRSKNLANSKSDVTQRFKSGYEGGRRPARPSTSAPAAAARPGSATRAPRTPANLPSRTGAARPSTGPSRVPAARPPSQIPRAPAGESRGAFSGGRQSQVESNRGSRSRQSASSRGSRPSPSRGGSRPSRGGGGRRGR